MKTTIISLTALSLTLCSFMTNTSVIEKTKASATSYQLGERVMHAFKKSSSTEYAALFPSSSDFTGMMRESAEIYGSHLAEAQSEFTQSYKVKLVPTVKHAFEEIVKEGNEQGIEWSNAKYISVETSAEPSDKFSPVLVTIVFTSSGIEHRLIIDNALVINGTWNVSQYIKLI